MPTSVLMHICRNCSECKVISGPEVKLALTLEIYGNFPDTKHKTAEQWVKKQKTKQKPPTIEALSWHSQVI